MHNFCFYREFYTERHIQAVKQFLELISTSSNSSGITKQRPMILQEQPVVLKEGYVYRYLLYFSFSLISLSKIHKRACACTTKKGEEDLINYNKCSLNEIVLL